jgi:pSer/pThr/pTyr-binding forkhead associated (FHA) protein
VDGDVVEELDLEGSLVIGRSTKADVRLAYKEVSSRHGRLERVGDAVQFTDLGSTNGTFLDDGTRLEPDSPVLLEVGGKLLVGPALIEVVVGPAEGAKSVSMLRAKTMVVDQAGSDDLLVVLARFKASRARLVVAAEHERKGVAIESMETTIGRSAPAQVVIPHASVSSEHAELRFEDGGFVLEDLGSSNGTRVGGRPITRPTTLDYQSAVTIGTVECLFVQSEPQADAAGEDPFADCLADHVVSLNKATRLQAGEALREHRAGTRCLGEWFVVNGLLTPGEWVEIHGQREVLRTLQAAKGGGGGGGNLPWVVAGLAVVAAAIAAYLLVSGS